MSDANKSNTEYWGGGKVTLLMSGVVNLGIAQNAHEDGTVKAALGLGLFGLCLVIKALTIPNKTKPEP